MPILVVNFKNYPEVLGEGSLLLAGVVEKQSERSGVQAVVAPPAPFLALVASRVKIGVFSQGLDASPGDKTTGAVIPEAVKAAGASGSILNHSESRLLPADLKTLVPKVKSLDMTACVCARTTAEALKLAELEPPWIAVEPPELIGTGIAVSKARPDVISGAVERLRSSGYSGKVLCGAGIASGPDARAAIELGADGILVSSAVVKARDWGMKVAEICRSLV